MEADTAGAGARGKDGGWTWPRRKAPSWSLPQLAALPVSHHPQQQQQEQQQAVWKPRVRKSSIAINSSSKRWRRHALNLLVFFIYSCVFLPLLFRRTCILHNYIARRAADAAADADADPSSLTTTRHRHTHQSGTADTCPLLPAFFSRRLTSSSDASDSSSLATAAALQLARGPHGAITAAETLWRRVAGAPTPPAALAADMDLLRAASPALAGAHPAHLRAVLRLATHYLRPWAPVVDVAAGDGPAGGNAGVTTPPPAPPAAPMWDVNRTRAAATYTNLMTCCMHVRVVGGRVWFRYGRFLMQPYRINRANALVTFLQATVDRYGLQDLRTEFLFNTCDHPLAAGATAPGGPTSRANYLVWSNHVADGFTDVLAPDFLDLEPEYLGRGGATTTGTAAGDADAGDATDVDADAAAAAAAATTPWRAKKLAAVFRGATTNFNIHAHNWVSSPRLRLHRLSDAFPHLLDARISRWSHVTDPGMRRAMAAAGLAAAPRIDFAAKHAFKYELVLDGGLGTTRLCGVLLTGTRAMLRQASPFSQFFDPLFVPGRHFVPVAHALGDVPAKLAAMRRNDATVRAMAARARAELGWTCTREGRMLAFAVLLVKHAALTTTGADGGRETITAPRAEEVCRWGAVARALDDLPTDSGLDCMDRPGSPLLQVPGCPTFCSAFGVHQKDWRWLTVEDVRRAQQAAAEADAQATTAAAAAAAAAR